MSDPPAYRVSDQQREQAAQEIREHFAAGRLSDDEMSDRLGAAYRAQTEQDLIAIRADLPKLPATPAQQKAEIAERRGHLQRRLLQQTGGGVGAFLVGTAIWLASGAHGQFWPIWIGIVVLLPLLRGGWQLYGPAPELDTVEHNLTERERERRREQRRDRAVERYGERQARRRGRRPDR